MINEETEDEYAHVKSYTFTQNQLHQLLVEHIALVYEYINDGHTPDEANALALGDTFAELDNE